MLITWDEFESRVYEWWSEALTRFLEEHPDETYFGMAGLCNPFNPNFSLTVGCETPIHRRPRAGNSVALEDRRRDPSYWVYRSIDFDRTTQEEFRKRFQTILAEIFNELMSGNQDAIHPHFEGYMETMMRAMLRLERELVKGSPRFEEPTDLFVHFENEDLDTSRARYHAIREGKQLEPGWSRQVPSL